MKTNKKSFVLHSDALAIIEELTMEQRGELLTAIYNYQNGIELGEMSQIMKIVFLPFKNQFERDNDKYAKSCETNRQNALSRSKPINYDLQPVEAKEPEPEAKEAEPQPVAPDKDKDSVKEKKKVNKKVSVTDKATEFLALFNELKSEAQPKSIGHKTLAKTSINNLEKLLGDGYTHDDFKRAIPKMLKADWVVKTKNDTPEHFLREENFLRYLNQANKDQAQTPGAFQKNNNNELEFRQ